MRVGRIEFVNCFPLYHHFARELAALGVAATIVEGNPAVLNEMLVSGAIDVALPSSIAFARNAAELALLPQVSISSFGAVDSVQLFTRVPLNDVRRVALTEKSATSICLLKVLCREWGLEPEFAPRRGSLAEVLVDFDGLLLIGDEALYVLRAEVYPYHYDLGAEWQEVTGLPMVFAVCAARRALRGRPAGGGSRRGGGPAGLARRLRRAPGRDGRRRGAALRFQPALPRGVLREAQVRLHARVPRRSGRVLPAGRGHRRARAGPRRRCGRRGDAGGRPVPAPTRPAPLVSCTSLTFRRPIPADYERVVGVMVAWWGGRDLRPMLPKIFFEHFRSTSLIVEHEDELIGFLVGFLCPDHDDEAYIHFAGVHPAWRRAGLARDMYRRFFAIARARGRTVVRAVTGPTNASSIAFHTALGFAILPGDEEVDGLPVIVDHGPQGDHVVRFELIPGNENDA